MIQIAYVNVFVSDLDRAIEFFGTKLGLALTHSDAEHGYASFDTGTVRLGLAVADAGSRDLVGHHTGIGFAVADLEGEHSRLSELDVAFPMPPTRQPWGGFMALMSDPDGNVFYLDEVAAAHS